MYRNLTPIERWLSVTEPASQIIPTFAAYILQASPCMLTEDLFLEQEIPKTLRQLTVMKSLNLDKNQIRSVPPEILQGCSLLQALNLHSNPISPQVGFLSL